MKTLLIIVLVFFGICVIGSWLNQTDKVKKDQEDKKDHEEKQN